MNLTMILPKGTGYYDVTEYPYGGCFRRAAADTVVAVGGGAGHHPAVEVKVILPSGRAAVVKRSLLIDAR